MNQFNFTDAERDDTSLLIGIAGASGSGKTYSALKMATGLAQGEPIFAIDTEAKRMLHYANEFKFKHLDMRPPFTPEAFMGAIGTAEKAGAKVIIVDSMSDEYEGVGGLQEMHDDEVARLARKPFDQLEGWQIDKFNAPGWKIPKTRHKVKLISPLRQVRCYVIFCMRAEEKIRFVKVKDDQGREKTAIEQAGWTPIAEKRFMYDMTMSFTVTPENPGVPLIHNGQAVYGKLQQQHLAFFPEGKRVSEEAGRQLRAWARGETVASSRTSSPATARDAESSSSHGSASTNFSSLLSDYHRELAKEAFREELEETHSRLRTSFASVPDSVRAAARNILNIHTSRVEDRIDAETAAAEVQQVIDGVAA